MMEGFLVKLTRRLNHDDRASRSGTIPDQGYSVAPMGFDILKASDFEAGIWRGAPVAGLRPSRADRSLTAKRPKPLMTTSSPRFAASMIAAKIELMTSFAFALERSLASAMASTSSVVFKCLSFNKVGHCFADAQAATRGAQPL